MKITTVLIFVLVFSACGSDTPDDSVAAFCQVGCERQLKCGELDTGETKESCVVSCKANGDPVASNYKPGFLGNLTACYTGLACDESEDDCIGQALAKINPNWTTDPELLACVQTAKTCNATGTGFSDDYCQELIFLKTDAANKLRACLALTCGSIKACLQAL